MARALLPPDPEEWSESLQHLSETGKVSGEAPWEGSSEERALFFPQWLGIPDDAGGYWYSPASSPAGLDMYGMSCRYPTSLGDGWWMCGL